MPSLVEPPIGRDSELEELRSLVARHRLVSIVGPGGIGKTTIALALADALRTSIPDGVWWVELAALSDERLIGETVGHALGVRLAPGRPPAEALAAALGEVKALILLDNCEHLSAAIAPLVDALLRHMPMLRVVVTSQEPLRTPHEHLFRLEALPAPRSADALDPTKALGYAAVRLFVERAKAGDRRFEVSPSNVGAIAEICRRLDGIPLAIELAAARVPLMGVEGLRQRLDERLRVLTAGARSVLPRHQTLRATLEWSHGLLPDVEQIVFRRLAVFSGGASLQMVQAVAADSAIDEWMVLSALGVLVDRSLVVADGGDEPRYRLLETTRAYAAERLAVADETAAWMRRHAQAVIELLVAHAGDGLFANASPRLAAELDNVRAAIDWALGAGGDAELAIPLVASSFAMWRLTAGTAEGLGYAEAAARFVGPATPAAVRAAFWRTYAALGLYTSRRDCFEAAQRAVELARDLGDAKALYEALILLTALGTRRREFAAARAAAAEAARIEDVAWSPVLRAPRAFADWLLALHETRYADARVHALRQAELNRATGSARGEQVALGNVATCDLYDGRLEECIKTLRSVIAELERLGFGHAAGHAQLNLTAALLERGEVMEARTEAQRAYALLRREGDQGSLLHSLARLAAARGDAVAALKVAGFATMRWERDGIVPGNLLSPAELAPDIAPIERDALMAEGATLAEEQVFRLVLSKESE